MPTRVLFIGADALDKDTVLAWAQDGTMPTFQRLMREGAWGITESPPGLFVGAIWPTFWTSVGPDRHARYCYEQLRPGTYEKHRIHPNDTRAPAFWNAIGEAGRRVAVIDVPKTHIVAGLNGIHVVDWGTHDPDFKGPVTWPASLAHDLVERYGDDKVGNCNTYGRAGDYGTLRDQLIDRVLRRTQLLKDTIAESNWDAVIAAFSESHCVGHQCWHLHDPDHVKHDADVAARVGDPVRDVYVAIDRAIGELIEAVGPDTEVLVLGSHGMRPHYDATFMLEDILKRIERPGVMPKPETAKRAKGAWKRVPRPIRALLSPLKGPAKRRLGLSPLASRRFFAVPNNDAYGAVRINLAGREPNGRVQPDEFDGVCAALENDLRALTNAETGEPLVREILRTRDLYRGPQAQHLPDLMIEWNSRSPISRVQSEKIGEITGVYTKCRTGDHSPHGIFAALGARVRPGRIVDAVSVMDFGPTIADRLGVALDDVDGRSFAGSAFDNAA